MPPDPKPRRSAADDDPLWFQVPLEFILDVTVRVAFRGLKWVGRACVLLLDFVFEFIA